MSIEEFRKEILEKTERLLSLYSREEIEVGDYIFNFYNTGEFVVLGFCDKRLKIENHLEYHFVDQSCLKRNLETDVPGFLELKKISTVFNNKPIKIFIPIEKYEVHFPRKFVTTKTIQNWMPGGDFTSGNYVYIPSEFTEQKEYTEITYNQEDLRDAIKKEIPKFLNKVQNRINLNTIFINSTKRENYI